MTDTNQQTTPCSRCQAPILEDDFDQGFALYDKGNAICKLCVDSGSSEEQENANRSVIRAQIQQQNIHRYSDGKNPDLNRFTFLTAGHIALHRLVARDQGAFDPPELDLSDDAETQEFSRRDQTTREAATTRRADKMEKAGKGSKGKKNQNMLIGIAAAAVVLVILSVVLMTGGNNNPGPSKNDPQLSNVLDAEKKYGRSDFPINAHQ
ncbi:MAG: hypothetical protein HRU15_04015, partial [Planctomycetes bacterium]|nr:hypothetical protein [Planctomycetota bacterium]